MSDVRVLPSFPAWCLAAAALTLQACAGGGNDSPAPPTSHALVAVKGEPAGANCVFAGRAVLAGLDVNNDGDLQPSEVSSTQYVCNLVNAAPGVTGVGGKQILAVSTTEAAGANCPSGGIRVATGLDLDVDGALSAGEVVSTAFVCHSLAPLHNLLIAAVEPTGSCANGGNRVVSGFDTDVNGILDGSEMDRNYVVCDSVPSSSFPYADITTSITMAADNGYLAWSPTPITFTLPLGAAIGAQFRITGTDSGGWTVAQQSGQQILISNPSAATWAARAPAGDWRTVASSADGSKLVAVEFGGTLQTSNDHGITWTVRDTNRSWFGVASSADGTKLVATVLGGNIYTSTDSGVTWTPRDASRSWVEVASSADGTRLVATEYGGKIYTSTDSGVTWAPRTVNRAWSGVASSADGMSLVAVVYQGNIYTSTDGGSTWIPRDIARDWYVIASSADGSKLVAAVQLGQIYTSTDSGATWTARESARDWSGVASSSDGKQLFAAAAGSSLFTSSNGGITWTPRETARNWNGIASSADGHRLVAVERLGGQIYTSTQLTTPGAAGSVSGTLDESIELEYLGGGLFDAVRSLGNLVVN